MSDAAKRGNTELAHSSQPAAVSTNDDDGDSKRLGNACHAGRRVGSRINQPALSVGDILIRHVETANHISAHATEGLGNFRPTI